jgi:hypothetical protein
MEQLLYTAGNTLAWAIIRPPQSALRPMPRQLLYLIVFIEGFCSLGAEVIALRRLVPHGAAPSSSPRRPSASSCSRWPWVMPRAPG